MSTRHVAAEDARTHDLTPEGSSGRASKRFRRRLAADGFTVDEGFRLKPGYLYTVVRAISARVNQNWDGWPSEELKKSYKTFLGKPVFVNHENHDPTKARGVVVAARYVENGMDKYIEVVQEIDAQRFPKLAHEIKTGGLDSVSMGAEAGFTICSYCHNKATDLDDMCDHVRNHKGKTLTRFDKRTGKKEDVLVFESCHKISFFELSYVFEPADETAVASKVVVAGKQASAPGWTGDERDEPGYREVHLDAKHSDDFYPEVPGYTSPAARILQRRMRDQRGNRPIEEVAIGGIDDPDALQDPFDPRIIGAGKYTKEDFAAAGGRKPWEASDEDEADVREIEAMIHKHSGECIPGVNCRGTGAPQGEQIFKDSPNNPVNQPLATGIGGVGGPGGGGGSGSGYQGNGKSGRDGLNPGAQAFYDQLAKDFPGASLGGFNPVVDQPWDEHATGDAIDFMTSDLEQGNAIRDRALANGAKHVIWQQKLWYPGGGVEDMEDRGSPTENHFDHVHINLPTSAGGAKTVGTGGGGSSSSSSGGMMQATPTGLVPAQRAASVVNPPDSMPVLPRLRAAARPPSVKRVIPGFMPEPGARPIDFSKPVFVHTNRHAVNAIRRGERRRDIWSIKQEDPQTGVHVRGYAPELHLVNVRFNVQQAGARKFKDTQRPDGTGGQRVVHAGAYGHVAPPPDEPLDYSLTDYHPGFHDTFVHRDNGEPIHSADHVHFSPDVRVYSAQDDNWGRDHEPQLLIEPSPSVNAANLHTVGGEPQDRPPVWQGRTAMIRNARRTALVKTARNRALRLAWGEKEAPAMVDTLREEGSAPEDDNDDFERYVDPPKELRTPDLSQAQQIDREQEIAEQGGQDPMGQPGPADPAAAQQPQPGFITLQVPLPSEPPQVPQAAVPPQAQVGQPQQMVASQQPEPKCPHCGIKQYDDNPHVDHLQDSGRCWKCSKPLNSHEGRITASMLDWFDRYYGRRVANWLDAIEGNRGMTPAEAADYRRQAARLSTLENGRELSTTNRNSTKGTSQMARSSNASRSKVARGRRQHIAEGPLVDGGDRSRNDQGEQEEAFISQTPPEVAVEWPNDDTPNIHNTENNLVARVQRGREQLLRDARALAAVQKRRAFDESGGPVAEVVDPRVRDSASEELTGDDFVSANPNDGVVPTNPKDASLRAFAAFDSWLAQKTGKSSRRHTEANIKKAAAQFSREAGISPQALFPALGIVLREARKNGKQASTKGAKMRKRSNESLNTAAPDDRIDVETPVKNTDPEAQASQFDVHDFGDNAGDNVAKPDLSTDQNWAPGEASGKKAAVKTAGGLLAMRCAEGMIAAGLEPDSRERKYQLAAEFERMNRGLIQDRVALLERFAAVRQAERRKVASGGSRGAARSPIPAGLGGGTRTAAAGMRTAAHDPSNDSSLFI